MSGVPKVALLIETSREYGRGVLRGIVRYARLHGPWAFYITPGDFEQALPKMEQWGGTGIIARIANPKVTEAILATGLPLVAMDLSEKQLAANSPLSNVCEIISDSYHAAQLAANHLLERGFPNYAFVGIAEKVWSERRCESFVKHISQAGYNTHIYEPPKKKHNREGVGEQKFLAEWLRDLLKRSG